MKNLKSYRLFESDSNYQEQIIKDIFQEVIDEFGLYEHDPDQTDHDLSYNIYRVELNKIKFWSMCSNISIHKDIQEYIDTNIVKRMENMGLTYLKYTEFINHYKMHYCGIDIIFTED